MLGAAERLLMLCLLLLLALIILLVLSAEAQLERGACAHPPANGRLGRLERGDLEQARGSV